MGGRVLTNNFTLIDFSRDFESLGAGFLSLIVYTHGTDVVDAQIMV